MPENSSLSLFFLASVTPDSAPWMVLLAISIVKDLIIVVPLLVMVLWLRGLTVQRQSVIEVVIALTVSLFASWAIGHLFPHDRPFVESIDYNFLHYAADDSFPSNHDTMIFTFALTSLCWYYLWSGSPLVALAVVIVWSHVHLGAHQPLDMPGGLLAGTVGCLGTQIIWQAMGHKLYWHLQPWYRLCFALPIRRGWVRDWSLLKSVVLNGSLQ